MIRHGLLILVILSTCGSALVPSAASAQSAPDPLVVPKIEGPIELNGRPDEAAWSKARQLHPVQFAPNFGAEPTETTEFLVGHTEDYLYAACRCYDRSSPSATSFKRDYFSGDIDYFILVLDTFNDDENALAFQTTPTGLRADEAIFNDAAGDPPSDASWDGFWDAAAT